jgi:hypothetical protein
MSVGDGVVRVQLESVFEKPRGDPGVLRHHGRHVRHGAQVEVVSVEAFRTLSPGAFDLRLADARLDDADHSFGDLILQVENVPGRAVESVRP